MCFVAEFLANGRSGISAEMAIRLDLSSPIRLR
jgi:hypothetical protein